MNALFTDEEMSSSCFKKRLGSKSEKPQLSPKSRGWMYMWPIGRLGKFAQFVDLVYKNIIPHIECKDKKFGKRTANKKATTQELILFN